LDYPNANFIATFIVEFLGSDGVSGFTPPGAPYPDSRALETTRIRFKDYAKFYIISVLIDLRGPWNFEAALWRICPDFRRRHGEKLVFGEIGK
jgi:hypothetical protein